MFFSQNWKLILERLITIDFPRSISVHNFSQFSTQDLWRELIFTLKGVRRQDIQTLNVKWELLCKKCACVSPLCISSCLCSVYDTLTRSISAFSSSSFCFLSFSQCSSSIRKYWQKVVGENKKECICRIHNHCRDHRTFDSRHHWFIPPLFSL